MVSFDFPLLIVMAESSRSTISLTIYANVVPYNVHHINDIYQSKIAANEPCTSCNTRDNQTLNSLRFLELVLVVIVHLNIIYYISQVISCYRISA